MGSNRDIVAASPGQQRGLVGLDRRPQADQSGPLRWEPLRRFLAIGRRSKPLWWHPMLALLGGLVLGLAATRFVNVEFGPFAFLVYEGDPESARSFVSLVATAVATITSLSLTITVVTLQLASSQYSPRLIEHYLDDRSTRAVISLFLLTFAFAVATLLNVRLPDDVGQGGEVPGPAISILVALVVTCLGALVLFVYRVTQSIRVESILKTVRDRTMQAIETRVANDPSGEEMTELPEPDPDGTLIRSRRTGFFVDIDRDLIADAHADETTEVWVLVSPGDFVTVGAPVALVSGGGFDDAQAVIEPWLQFDSERWIEADYAYGVRSLTDVALKALSPGINDPTTAVMAIQRISEVMTRAAESHPDRIVEIGGGGRAYLTIRTWYWLLSEVLHQLALYGRDDVDVVVGVIRMLWSLSWCDAGEARADEIEAAAELFRELIDVERQAPDQRVIDAEFDLLRRAMQRDVTGEFFRHTGGPQLGDRPDAAR